MKDNSAIIEICTVPFNFDNGEYEEDNAISYFVKVTGIPDGYDVRNLISEDANPGVMFPVCAYIADNDNEDDIIGKWDQIDGYVCEDEFEDDEIDFTYDFKTIMDYYETL